MAKKKKTIWQSVVGWVLQHVWPQIQKFIVEMIAELLDWLRAQFAEVVAERMAKRSEKAGQRADREEQKAATASSAQEAAEHRRLAEVWRKVADEFREENEQLRERLNAIVKDATPGAQQAIRQLEAEDVFDANDGQIRLRPDLLVYSPTQPALTPKVGEDGEAQ